MTSRCQGLFPPHPFFKGKALGTRLRDLGRDALPSHALQACEARALRVRKTLTARFTDFFTDFEKKTRVFCSLCKLQLTGPELSGPSRYAPLISKIWGFSIRDSDGMNEFALLHSSGSICQICQFGEFFWI